MYHRILSGSKNLGTKASFLHILMRFYKKLDVYSNFTLDPRRGQKTVSDINFKNQIKDVHTQLVSNSFSHFPPR